MYQHAQQPVEKKPAPAEPAAQRRAGSESAKPYPHRFGEYALEGPPRTAAAAADGSVVQRAVGLEFETAVALRTTPSKQQIPYGTTVFDGTGGRWQIKADSSNVEFVTDKFSETDAGEEQLGIAMDAITQMATAIIQSTQANPHTPLLKNVRPDGGTTYKYGGESITVGGKRLGANSMAAAPQATGGVTLAQIPALIDALISTKLEHLKQNPRFSPIHAKPKLEDFQELWGDDAQEQFEFAMGTYDLAVKPTLDELNEQNYDTTDLSYAVGAGATIRFLTRARRAVEAWEYIHYDDENRKDGLPTKNLDGLLTLVVSYLLNGSEQLKPLPYTKSAMTLMSRTNMHSLFGLLSESERKLFTLDAVAEISELDLSEQLYPGGFKSKGIVVAGPTRAEWVDSVIHGTPVTDLGAPLPSGAPVTAETPRVGADRLSQASNTPEALNSGSTGAQNEPDVNPRTGANDLAVLEIRNMAKSQPLNSWRQTALTIFEMFRRLHETPQETQQRLLARQQQQAQQGPPQQSSSDDKKKETAQTS